MAIDVEKEAEKIARSLFDHATKTATRKEIGFEQCDAIMTQYLMVANHLIDSLVTRAVADAKLKQMEADCKAVCVKCKFGFNSLDHSMFCQNIRTAFAATEPPTHEEVCWLIERGQQEGQCPSVWWAGDQSGSCLNWVYDADKAIKYSTKSEAEKALDAISGIKGVHSPMGHVTEHAFVGPPATEPVEMHINTRGCTEPLDPKTVAALGELAKVAHSQLSAEQIADARQRFDKAAVELAKDFHYENGDGTETCECPGCRFKVLARELGIDGAA